MQGLCKGPPSTCIFGTWNFWCFFCCFRTAKQFKDHASDPQLPPHRPLPPGVSWAAKDLRRKSSVIWVGLMGCCERWVVVEGFSWQNFIARSLVHRIYNFRTFDEYVLRFWLWVFWNCNNTRTGQVIIWQAAFHKYFFATTVNHKL